MKTANEIIETLYKNGAITFEEANTLYNKAQEAPEKEEDKYLNPVVTLKSVCDDAREDVDENFDYDRCVNFMKRDEWCWAGEEVDKFMFKSALHKAIDDVIGQAASYVKEHNIPVEEYGNIEHQFGYASGGYEVVGWFDTDGRLYIAPKFVIEETETNISAENVQACSKCI